MKSMKKCIVTKQNQSSIIISKLTRRRNKRCSSAGMFYTSSAGAVTSLILLFSLCSLFSIFTGTINAYADTAINLSIDTSTLNLDILPTSASGTFAKSDNANISVSTNSPTGYELSIKASSTDTNARNLVNGNEVIKSFNSLTTPETAVTEASFKALANTKYNGMWGFLPSKYNSSANADFIVAPDSNGILIDSTSSANPDTANNYTLAIGARVDSSTKLGLYSNTYVITAVANGTAYSFIYNDNVVSNMPSDKMSMTTATSENLASNTPERDGYTFIGWCLGTASSSNITTTDGVDTCSSTVYQPSASVAIASGSTNDKYLYAMWQKAAPYIQDYTLATCQAEASSDNVTVKDKRDNNEYTVRYINGACWMTQNLRFTGTSLSTTTSNVSANRTISYGDLISGNSYTEARIHNSDDTTTGVWYNFCAAGAKETGACTDSSKYTSSYDICPKNWHLPTDSQFSGITSYKDAFSPVAGGRYYDGSLDNTGNGYWWSATANNADYQYYLYYNGSSLSTYDNRKNYGRYVRCVRSS